LHEIFTSDTDNLCQIELHRKCRHIRQLINMQLQLIFRTEPIGAVNNPSQFQDIKKRIFENGDLLVEDKHQLIIDIGIAVAVKVRL